jgi:hypothetical protein
MPQFLEVDLRKSMEEALPIGDIIFLAGITVAFVGFAIVLGWAEHQTRGIGR